MPLESITEIDLDINQPRPVVVHAKQYDTVRKVKARLFNAGVAWSVPSGNYLAVVAYRKADHIGGLYDHTEDGILAVSVDGTNRNVITIHLDRNVLTTAGDVSIEVTFYGTATGSNIHLSTFSFTICVEQASLQELDLASNPFFNVLATDIAAVLNAEANLTGITASATTKNAGTSATVTVTGGSGSGQPYNFAFGIPKGDQGIVGPTATPSSVEYSYANSSSVTSVPSSGWSSTPSPVKGQYLWSRAVVTWSNNTTTTTYSVGYEGVDGSGAVNSINGKVGNVVLNADDIELSDGTTIQDMIDGQSLVIDISSFSSLPKTVTNAAITADHVVVESTLGTPAAQTGNWTVTTSNGSLTISGSMSGSTTVRLTLVKAISAT